MNPLGLPDTLHLSGTMVGIPRPGYTPIIFLRWDEESKAWVASTRHTPNILRFGEE
jgi:hypothetical protein